MGTWAGRSSDRTIAGLEGIELVMRDEMDEIWDLAVFIIDFLGDR